MLRTAGGQGLNVLLKLAALVISAQRTPEDLDGEVQRVSPHPAGRRPTQAWNVMGKRCPGDAAVETQPTPSPCQPSSTWAWTHIHTHTHLHAHT